MVRIKPPQRRCGTLKGRHAASGGVLIFGREHRLRRAYNDQRSLRIF